MQTPPPPLSGIRVLDLSNLFAGPVIGMYLGDFGAEVIKVEHPQRGDELRRWGHLKDGIGTFFKVVNRNKKLITLNLSVPQGQDLARRLARECDVVLSNFRPGRMEGWGLGYEDLSKENPGLVMASVSGFGQTGTYANRPGFGTIAESFTGPTYLTGFPDREPLLPQFGLGDATTGIFGAFGILLALYHRDVHGGKGQFIDLAIYEGVFNLMGPTVIDYGLLGIVGQRSGNRQTLVAPRNAYETADDEWIAISASTQATWQRTAEALGVGEIVHDPRFVDNESRVRHVEDLDAILQKAIRRFTRSEVLARLERAGAVAGAVYNIAQVFDDPHIQSRGNIINVPDDDFGTAPMQNVVPRLSRTPGRIEFPGRNMGADNEAVFQDLVGLDGQEMAALREGGVI